MNYGYNNQIRTTDELTLNKFMSKVFGWMFIGLLITAAVSYATFAALLTSDSFYYFMSTNYYLIYLSFIIEVIIVIALSKRIHKISVASANFLFLFYSALNGFNICFILLMYTGTVIFQAFLAAAICFGIMFAVGAFTSVDLSKIGSICVMALIGIILLSIMNMFMGSSQLDFIVTIAALVIFFALTAWDAQNIKNNFYQYASVNGPEAANKIAVIGALKLYLDFINIFLYLLRLFGRKR